MSARDSRVAWEGDPACCLGSKLRVEKENFRRSDPKLQATYLKVMNIFSNEMNKIGLMDSDNFLEIQI